MKKILVLGATGMLGHAIFRYFSESSEFEVFGSIRELRDLDFFKKSEKKYIFPAIDVINDDELKGFIKKINPDLVINCVGVIKQKNIINDAINTIELNSLLPHRLALICEGVNARLIHVSTDCVFKGDIQKNKKYSEDDIEDALDFYGKSKSMGEVKISKNVITLRTSIIGHELKNKQSLIDWFLNQKGLVHGYRNAFFTGLPTVEIARIIKDFVIPNEHLFGLYHVSADVISKYDLLKLVAQTYKKEIDILPYDEFYINRSLDSSRFRELTGFVPKKWSELISEMNYFG